MVKKILIALAVVLALFLVVVAAQPGEFRVERSAIVSAPAAAVFAHVNDFHRWEAWSPWGKLDPGMKTTFSGSAAGVGAIYYWIGNDKVGEGRMTIVESGQGTLVRIKLEFIKPFASTSDTAITFQPDGGGTRVAWVMSGPLGFIEKAMCLFKNMDAVIGPDFEKGLAQLKAAAEAH